ncbi:MAG TPA: hypothetical protein VH333_23305 [Pseudonocardiaceae bacterium]|nr:hypothetical protein [Pseudonocardiaceae bacterium]
MVDTPSNLDSRHMPPREGTTREAGIFGCAHGVSPAQMGISSGQPGVSSARVVDTPANRHSRRMPPREGTTREAGTGS